MTSLHATLQAALEDCETYDPFALDPYADAERDAKACEAAVAALLTDQATITRAAQAMCAGENGSDAWARMHEGPRGHYRLLARAALGALTHHEADTL